MITRLLYSNAVSNSGQRRVMGAVHLPWEEIPNFKGTFFFQRQGKCMPICPLKCPSHILQKKISGYRTECGIAFCKAIVIRPGKRSSSCIHICTVQIHSHSQRHSNRPISIISLHSPKDHSKSQYVSHDRFIHTAYNAKTCTASEVSTNAPFNVIVIHTIWIWNSIHRWPVLAFSMLYALSKTVATAL